MLRDDRSLIISGGNRIGTNSGPIVPGRGDGSESKTPSSVFAWDVVDSGPHRATQALHGPRRISGESQLADVQQAGPSVRDSGDLHGTSRKETDCECKWRDVGRHLKMSGEPWIPRRAGCRGKQGWK